VRGWTLAALAVHAPDAELDFGVRLTANGPYSIERSLPTIASRAEEVYAVRSVDPANGHSSDVVRFRRDLDVALDCGCLLCRKRVRRALSRVWIVDTTWGVGPYGKPTSWPPSYIGTTQLDGQLFRARTVDAR